MKCEVISGISRPQRIPIVLCVDVEPFRRQIEQPPEPHWHGAPETLDRLDRWRPWLAEATGAPVRFSWFWRADPQIEETYGSADWGLVRYRAVWESTTTRGDEHGVHPHAWRRNGSSGRWISDYRDPRWIARCIRLSLDTFERHLGRPCRLIRFGDRWMSTRTARVLERLGVHVDLTVEPGAPPEYEDSNAPKPDYTAVRSRPYRPARSNFLRSRRLDRRRGGLVMLPLTTASPAPDGRRHVFRPWDDPVTTVAAVDALLREGQRYLAFAVRTSVCVSPTAWANLETLVTHLARHPLADRFVFVTPSDAVEILSRRW